MMSVRGKLRAAVLATLPLVVAGFAVAQQPAAGQATGSHEGATAATSADARLVNVPVVVLDKKGALVQNLTKDDFTLLVDKKPAAITSFGSSADLPLTLGLLVDTSATQRDSLEEERASGSALLDLLSGPADRDKAFVVQFARQIDLLQDTTSSRPKLEASVKQFTIDSAPAAAAVTSVSDPRNTKNDDGPPKRGVGTTLYDALFLSSNELMSKQSGRKAIIVVTDGLDGGSKESLESAIEAAQRADTVVYAVFVKGTQPANTDRGFHTGQTDNCQNGSGGGYPGSYPGGYPGGYPGSNPGGSPCSNRRPQAIPVADGRKTLEHIAQQTGGAVFEAGKKETLADIYKEIGDDLRAQYRIGFSPDKDASSGGYHRIVLSLAKLNPKDFYIQTRDGYYFGD